jgi:hypothetical protein
LEIREERRRRRNAMMNGNEDYLVDEEEFLDENASLIEDVLGTVRK